MKLSWSPEDIVELWLDNPIIQLQDDLHESMRKKFKLLSALVGFTLNPYLLIF